MVLPGKLVFFGFFPVLNTSSSILTLAIEEDILKIKLNRFNYNVIEETILL